MNDKEKKAIESFKSYINAIDTFGTIDPKCCNNLYEPVKIVLQLLEKQNAEIKEMREECKVCVVRNDLHNYIEETEKKDKIIDKMAEEIFIKRALAITSEQDIDRLKQKIIGEYKNKV